MSQKSKIKKGFWIPLESWNLNEIFITESISPLSFYEKRNFGNKVSRSQEKTEGSGYLVLFKKEIKNDILLFVHSDAIDNQFIFPLSKKLVKKVGSENNLSVFAYPKTIFLRKGNFELLFSRQEIRDKFLANAFMLLEVKAVSKYFEVGLNQHVFIKSINDFPDIVTFQHALVVPDRKQPFFDKVVNHIKGYLYGYVIGKVGSFSTEEQNLLSGILAFKNSTGGTRTNLVLSESYSNVWLINLKSELSKIKTSQNKIFASESTSMFDTIELRLNEIDSLNRMRCDELRRQKDPRYRVEYESFTKRLENEKIKLYKIETKLGIRGAIEELQQIKDLERENGGSVGKARKYFKIGTPQYERKQELNRIIKSYDGNPEIEMQKHTIEQLTQELNKFTFGYTIYDTSLDEQFNRISDSINDLYKKTTNHFICSKNKSLDIPSFLGTRFDIEGMLTNYQDGNDSYGEYLISLDDSILDALSEDDKSLLRISINAILSMPQGYIGSISEEKILKIITMIGRQLPEGKSRQILQQYYLYRINEKDTFEFPEDGIIRVIIVFLMKTNGFDQMNKMLVNKNIDRKDIAYLLWGAFIGFANLPKTFTNIIFESNNNALFEHIDNYLFQFVICK